MNLGTCVDRLCGEVFCSVTSSAAGTNSSSHCPVYSYIRPFTLRCKTLDEHLDAEHLHRLHFDSDEAMDGSLEKVLLPQNISNSSGHSLLQYAVVHGVSYGVRHGVSHGVRYGVGHELGKGSVMGSVIGLVMGIVRRSQCQKSLFVAPLLTYHKGKVQSCQGSFRYKCILIKSKASNINQMD